MKSIVYVVSLPRSGSTLLQRIISSSDNFKYVPESWFFLNSYQTIANLRGNSEYGFEAMKRAHSHFGDNAQRPFFLSNMRKTFIRLYGDGDTKRIIEKTPRNVLVLDEIFESLECEDRIIILERDKTEILASYLRYFDNFLFVKSYKYFNEINYLQARLDNFVKLHSGDERVLTLNYADIVNDESRVISNLAKFLNDYTISGKLSYVSPEGFGDKRGKISSDIKKLVVRDIAFYVAKYFKIFMLSPFGILSLLVFGLNINLLVARIKGERFLH
jgi:hypothetical protein